MEKIYAIQIAMRAGVAILLEKQTSQQRKIGTDESVYQKNIIINVFMHI